MKIKAMMSVLTIIAVTVMIAVPISGEVEAADSDGVKETSYYFYGDNPEFIYEYKPNSNIDLVWTVTDQDGQTMEYDPVGGDQWRITVDIAGVTGPIKVQQDVYPRGSNHSEEPIDTAIVYAYPLHIGADTSYTVTFMDGSKVFDKQVIDRRTVVEVGKDHVFVPADPSKDGYTFDDWYVDKSFSQRFDPTVPITDDTVVYARWVGTGEGSSGTIYINGEDYTVVFQATEGLEYSVSDVVNGRVSFTVGVVGGYQLKDGTLSVTSDRGSITYSDGAYRLTGVNGDTIVTIDGDVSQITKPVEPSKDPGFPWWIILLIALIAIVVVILIWWRYRNKDDEEDVPEAVQSTGDVVFETVQGKKDSEGLREADSDSVDAKNPSDRKD